MRALKTERQRLVPDSVLKQADSESGQLPDSRAEGEAHSIYELYSRNARECACICCPDVNTATQVAGGHCAEKNSDCMDHL